MDLLEWIAIVSLSIYAVLLMIVIWYSWNHAYWKRSAHFCDSLAEQRIYHYVKHPYSVKSLPNGHVLIEPRMRISPRGKDLAWLVVYTFAIKQPLSFFFIGRNGKGGKLNFGKTQQAAAADLVIIEGRDFVDYMGRKKVFWRRIDRSIATQHGYRGRARVVRVPSLSEDRLKLSDDHLDQLERKST